MKKISLLLILSVAVCSTWAQNGTGSVNIIPLPVKVSVNNGTYPFANTGVKSSGFTNTPLNLVSFAEQMLQNNTAANAQNASFNTSGQLLLQLDKNFNLPAEGYRLSVNGSGIHITGKTERGIFYGLQTLAQLLAENAGNQALPFVEIEDYPRFAYRGLHLDVGRHYFPVSFLKTYIDLLAQYKLNTFHWHLTEDQGWRIEIKKYPKLTSVGAYRAQTLIGSNRDKQPKYDGTRYGGFYTQDEVKEVVAYAASKYVTVIPEIEMPGHSMAALSAYPELACGDNPGPFKAAERWGVFPDVYCAGKESTFKFLEDVLDEVLPLFPSEYIHIGGDECPKTRWKTCPYCQKRIKKLHLKDEHELQSYFIQRIEKYLNKKGKHIIGWDEILEGGLAPNATVMSWRGIKGGIAAAQQNHNVIMTPGSHLYIDHPESSSPEEPLTIGGRLVSLETLYSYNPVPAELTPDQQKYILGVQANLWTEYVETPEKALYLLLPRLYALSEVAWTPLQSKNWTDFSQKRLPEFLAKLDRTDLLYRVPTPIGAKDTTITGSSFTLDYKAPVKGAKIYYTINGYIPYSMDYLYEKPVTINVPAGEERVIKSVVITPSGKRSVVTTTVVRNGTVTSAR
ncbi:family 20 glycosylhydrolase [Pedobacter sp. BS3]|uniref:beta-N-acetylhexosaminidase n=1 Tax=Pedobacter sp. BS3 TaxID=2567937 RepID=UPI0011EC29CC|nr:family 20 glycosylhydrolase [Pedobacter sp. BS3]TZF82233.1 family 20 glycosylhydrolase [Pedobacter sp. BS3]